jgi:O-methyltransferase
LFYGIADREDQEFLRGAIERFRKIFRNVHAADNVILFGRSLGFRRDPKLMDAFRGNVSNHQERSLLLRINTLAWAAAEAQRLDGDFVECGVWRGFCSAVLTHYLDFQMQDRTFYLYDTFEGIPPDLDSEKHDSPLFREAGLYESVLARFTRYPNVRVVKGTVPDSFAQSVPERIAFMHIDMNSSKSEIATLEALFDRIVPGGLVVFDDYGWTGYQAQQVAEDAWTRRRGHRILELPTGQGLLIRH